MSSAKNPESTQRSYARSGLVEFIRKQLRIADFLRLLRWLRLAGNPSFNAMRRQLTFIELGPGPTRLARLKRRLFRAVYFVDQFDFGIPDDNLRIYDLEKVADAGVIAHGLCAREVGDPVFLFADHCLEHLPESAVVRLLQSIRAMGATACFRVPNIASRTGKRNFGNDPTHQTDFNESLRARLRDMGFAVEPWIRWYRLAPRLQVALGGKSPMSVAEEIAICCVDKELS